MINVNVISFFYQTTVLLKEERLKEKNLVNSSL